MRPGRALPIENVKAGSREMTAPQRLREASNSTAGLVKY